MKIIIEIEKDMEEMVEKKEKMRKLLEEVKKKRMAALKDKDDSEIGE